MELASKCGQQTQVCHAAIRSFGFMEDTDKIEEILNQMPMPPPLKNRRVSGKLAPGTKTKETYVLAIKSFLNSDTPLIAENYLAEMVGLKMEPPDSVVDAVNEAVEVHKAHVRRLTRALSSEVQDMNNGPFARQYLLKLRCCIRDSVLRMTIDNEVIAPCTETNWVDWERLDRNATSDKLQDLMQDLRREGILNRVQFDGCSEMLRHIFEQDVTVQPLNEALESFLKAANISDPEKAVVPMEIDGSGKKKTSSSKDSARRKRKAEIAEVRTGPLVQHFPVVPHKPSRDFLRKGR